MPDLTAYVIDGHAFDTRPAPQERDWMEATHQRYAYRCLPLNIANAHGWELLCTAGFRAAWDGTAAKTCITIVPDPGSSPPAVSHFGSGVLTFHVPCVFRTEPGIDLYVTGPVNRPKDAIAPLSAVVETDWADYSFTMNWLFTRPSTIIRFEKGEPICHFFPIARGTLEHIEPRVIPLSQVPEIEHRYQLWSKSRLAFNADLDIPGSQAVHDRWQKNYFRGQHPDGEASGTADHRSRLRLRPFAPAAQPSTANVTPASVGNRLSSAGPMAAAELQQPPGVVERGTSNASANADSARILDVEP
jgi:hypothetical protein